MARRTGGGRGRRPPTPRVTPKPPTPTIQERERRRGRRRQAAPVEVPIPTPVSHEDWRLQQIEPTYTAHEAWRLEQLRGPVQPYQGTQVGRWLTAAGEQGIRADSQIGRWLGMPGRPTGLGVGPNQVSRWLAASGGAAGYGGTEWGTGGAPGTAGGFTRHKTQAEAFLRGPGRFTPYVFDDTVGDGDGYGYAPAPAPRRYYAGRGQAAMRGTQQGYSTGLINWRIGL